MSMEPLDGNAIAGALHEAFGAEMTNARGTCAYCATVSRVAELVVYAPGLGMVARCPSCAGVVLVVIETRGSPQVHRPGLDAVELPS
jgi:hypothetical protein